MKNLARATVYLLGHDHVVAAGEMGEQHPEIAAVPEGVTTADSAPSSAASLCVSAS